MKKNNLASLLDALITNTTYGMLLTDELGEILYLSETGENIFGCSSEMAEGKNIRWLIPSITIDTDKIICQKEAMLPADSQDQGYQIKMVNKKEQSFVLYLTYSLSSFENTPLWTFICRDLTRINAEKQDTIEAKSRLDAIINTAVDGIITIDEKGTIESINPAAAHLFGYEPKEVINNNINMLMGIPHHEQHDQYLKNYMTTGVRKIIGIGRQVEGLRKDGTFFPFKLSISEINFDNKRIFTGIIHDVSDKVRAQEIERTLLKEKELSRLKSHFITIASHEFRTPLSTILSSASLIDRYTETDQNDKRQKHTQRIKKSVHHLTTILSDFLLLSKLDENLVTNQPIQFNLKNFLKEIHQEMEATIETSSSIHLSYEGKDEVYLDEKLLTNIIQNLLSNAIKYSIQGTPIYLETIVTEDQIKIVVKDQGIGIPIKEQQHLFERFFRANNAQHLQGTGIGLNIIKKYVTLMQGDITYHSLPEKGTTFTVTFPNKNLS